MHWTAVIALSSAYFVCVHCAEEGLVNDYLSQMTRRNSRESSKQTQFAVTEYIELARREAPACFADNEYLRQETISLLTDSKKYVESRPTLSVYLQLILSPCKEFSEYAKSIVELGDKKTIDYLLQIVRAAI